MEGLLELLTNKKNQREDIVLEKGKPDPNPSFHSSLENPSKPNYHTSFPFDHNPPLLNSNENYFPGSHGKCYT